MLWLAALLLITDVSLCGIRDVSLFKSAIAAHTHHTKIDGRIPATLAETPAAEEDEEDEGLDEAADDEASAEDVVDRIVRRAFHAGWTAVCICVSAI